MDDEIHDEMQESFVEEVSFMLEECEEFLLKLEKHENKKQELDKIFRVAHSIKGVGAAVGFSDISDFAHKVEDCLAVLRNFPELVDSGVISLLLKSNDAFCKKIELLKSQSKESWQIETLEKQLLDMLHDLQRRSGSDLHRAERPVREGAKDISSSKGASIKIDANRVEAALNIVGELVILKSQLQLTHTDKTPEGQKQREVIRMIDSSVKELHDNMLCMRMTPLRSLFLKVQRIVRDLSLKLDKSVDLQFEGEETEIDRTMIEYLGDPLVHLVRNALDHGIESKEEREKADKPKQATIKIDARQSGRQVLISVSDDGRGIDRNKVIDKAIKNGIIRKEKDTENIKDSEVFEYLFLPGFSTAAKVTDVSGRGVGLDVVKSNIETLRGSLNVTSETGKGSTFGISLPLTTAITEGIIVEAEKWRFIIPLHSIREFARFEDAKVTRVNQTREVIQIREKQLIFVSMYDLLNEQIKILSSEISEVETIRELSSCIDSDQKEVVVVVESPGHSMALKVDGVVGQSQVVVKPLSANFKQVEGIAGVSILGDGSVALIIDVDGLSRLLTESESTSESGLRSAA